MNRFLLDVRHAYRSLRRAPMFTAIAVASIALGIAANTAVFTLLDQVVLRQLPVRAPGELVQLVERGTGSVGGRMGDGTETSYRMYRELRDHNDAFTDVFCRFEGVALTVRVGDRSERASGELVSGNYFTALGVSAERGRLITPADDRAPGQGPVAVLSYAYWTSRFGRRDDIIGRSIVINEHPITIVGVTRPSFVGLDRAAPPQLYLPITMQPQMGPAWLNIDDWRFGWVQLFARLRPSMTAERASAAMQPPYQAVLRAAARDASFATVPADTREAMFKTRLAVEPANRGHSGLTDRLTQPLWILMTVAAGVLLIACANVANLLLARGTARYRELALRLALGAGRFRIVRLLVTESLLLATAGAALGLVLATWGAGFLIGFFSTAEYPTGVTSTPDLRVLLFTSAVTIASALASGVLPAWRSSRLDLAPTLKSSGGGVVGEQPTIRKALVVVQVALSFLLMIGAGLFVRTLHNLMQVDPGYRIDSITSFHVDLTRAGFDKARSKPFAIELVEALKRRPGVSGATFSFMGLLEGNVWGMDFTVEGYHPKRGQEPNAFCNAVGPGFFRVMGLPVVGGRDFDARDERTPAKDEKDWPYRHAVVNQTFVQKYMQGRGAIGRHIGIGGDPGTPTPIEIVGVIKDARYSAVRENIAPQVYFPLLEAGDLDGIAVYVKAAGNPSAIGADAVRVVARLDPSVAPYNMRTMEQHFAESITNERLVASLSAAFSIVATVLSIVGLYGVMAYTVTRRTREIGIRMALGALASQVALRILREAGTLVGLGLAAGGLASWWLGRYVANQLYGVTPTDALTLASCGALLLMVSAVAAFLPARRAAAINPMAALRDE